MSMPVVECVVDKGEGEIIGDKEGEEGDAG